MYTYIYAIVYEINPSCRHDRQPLLLDHRGCLFWGKIGAGQWKRFEGGAGTKARGGQTFGRAAGWSPPHDYPSSVGICYSQGVFMKSF